MTLSEKLAEYRKLLEKATIEVNDICQRAWGGDRGAWRMSIPARPEHDSDLVISTGLHAGQALLDLIPLYEAELELLRPRVPHLADPFVNNGCGWRCFFCYRDKGYGHEDCAWEEMKAVESALASAKEKLP